MLKLKVINRYVKACLAVQAHLAIQISNLARKKVFGDFNDNLRGIKAHLFNEPNRRITIVRAVQNPFGLDVQEKLPFIAFVHCLLQGMSSYPTVHGQLLFIRYMPACEEPTKAQQTTISLLPPEYFMTDNKTIGKRENRLVTGSKRIHSTPRSRSEPAAHFIFL